MDHMATGIQRHMVRAGLSANDLIAHPGHLRPRHGRGLRGQGQNQRQKQGKKGAHLRAFRH
ncbi:MAG: hypothetical protein B7Y02_07945 [Rhodobacterales bacterium 17-64-5]|nr:MAG: hypothetical protein B7Y02_07945 [Rhodobacterales bacterium 17-64-5]